MLFHTQEFIFLFLIPLIIVFYGFTKTTEGRQNLLLFASFCFYGYWDYRLLPLLFLSILGNWFVARLFSGNHEKRLIFLGVSFNLLLIGIFKYADFIHENFALMMDQDFSTLGIILPLGISFFTFQQISYLIDLKRGQAKNHGLREYALYVSFFPQLIAGPIVRHNELIDQLSYDPKREGLDQRISMGLAFLILGLCKKVFFSDGAAFISDPLFAKSMSEVLTFSESWTAVGAFSMQIYFDFSGYSDMAIGLALLFGVKLPFNFDAPYKAVSIQDFWRRWHMTLSRFLKDYLYIPLGGSHFGINRQMLALSVTMLLGGLWHGASWNFVIWGILHGLALALCAIWQKTKIEIPGLISWLITLLFVCLCWVIFRAENIQSAMNVYQGLISPFDHANWPQGKKVWVLFLGVIVIFAFPTTQKFVEKIMKPNMLIAIIFAGLAVLALMRMNGIYREEFIYFQF